MALLVLGLFYYWFAVADRYVIFLYGHTTVGIPEARPFDEMTSSRYWMAGLVAAGAVMVIYAAANWLAGRLSLRRGYVPPVWWQVWALAAIPVGAGIPAITMTVNAPTLPLRLALACAVATLAGLAFALWPGAWAARRPGDLLWLALDGAGLVPALLLLRAIELPGRGLSVTVPLAVLISAGGIVVGAAWLGVMSGLRRWRERPDPSAVELFAAGVCLSYLLLPLVHYLVATPRAYRYISTASNFFAFHPGLQILAFAVAAGLAAVVTWLRSWRRT